MKLLTPFTAIIAAAAAGQIYTTQPAEAYANSAEIYQSALEYQQQGLYSDQSHAFSGPSAGAELHAYAGQHGDAGQSAYAGHGQSRPAGEKTARILSYESGSDGHGYQYAFETENGIKAQEIGQVTGHEKGTEAHGAYSYKGDDGQVYTVTYTAGEHGFNAQGAHLPTPPPIPEAIVKSLEQNAKDEAAGIYDDGKYPAQHESYQEQAIHGHAAGPLATQAFQYETSAIQHEFQPNQYQQGHQGLVQGHQFIDQGGHQSGQIGQVQGHQGLVQGHQLIDQGGHQTGHQIGLVQGHQGGQGYQLGSQQDHQPRGFQPSYIVASDGYHKH